MRVLDLGYGTGSATLAWKAHGHEVIGVDWESPSAHILGDWKDSHTWKKIKQLGPYDFVWFSPDCSIFSLLNANNPFDRTGEIYDPDRRYRVPRRYTPNTERAKEEVRGIINVIRRIKEMSPSKGWIMENPRAIMRRMDFVKGLNRVTVCYCQYADTFGRRKPTDLFGEIPRAFIPLTCKTGDSCHVNVSKGEIKGTVSLSKRDRGRVPYGLSMAIYEAAISNEQPSIFDYC